MGSNNMPSNLHKRLPLDLREQVEHALRFPSPGLSTYQEVYDHFELGKHGVEHGTVERAGKKLRDEVKRAHRERLRALRELRDAIQGEAEVSGATADLMYAELFEHMVGPERDPKKIFALSAAIKSIVSANIARQVESRKSEDWERQEAAKKAIEAEADKTPDRRLDPATVADVIDRVMRGEELHAA
ncbi:MAG TPA: hypothetical protein VMY42_26375 [Thermoguttaceae bacterium]|nr:hypothetical protein [Thermoguttaceae bacterium]